MSVVVAAQLEKRYGDQLVFSQVAFRIEWGDCIGLVGPNGSGKSTLMRIIAGQDDLYGGQMSRSRRLTIGCLEQEPLGSDRRTVLALLDSAFADLHALGHALEELAVDIEACPDERERQALLDTYGRRQAEFEHRGGYDTERRLQETLRHLRIPEQVWHAPVSSLSGGQRTRLHLGFLILSRPQLLLLDEPTNYLDAVSMPWLVQVLAAWQGSLVIISHSHGFLDQVATRIWEMDHHTLTLYHGNHSHYRLQRAERRERQAREYRAQQEYIARTEDFIHRFKAGQRSKEARGRATRMKRFLAEHAVDRPQADRQLRLTFPATVRSGEIVMRTHNLAAGYTAGAPILTVPDLEVRRTARVALLGPNGTGKSTLLRTLVGQIRPLQGSVTLGANVRLGYFAQHQVRDDYAVLDAGRSAFDLVQARSRLLDQETRDHLARFQLAADDVFRPIATLSGGQKSRLMFALLALQDTNFLVLDEPMSHFDSAGVLQEALRQYAGTILFVTHDQALVEALATQLWFVVPEAEDGPARLMIRTESWQDHARDREDGMDREPDDPGALATRENGRRGPVSSARARATREKELEAEIQDIEQKIGVVVERLSQASVRSDAETIRKMRKVHRFLEEQADQRWDEWISLQEE